MTKEPQIYTFYSFKGGVGRTMTLMNLAYALAMRGRHVLMVDMDLEAPGLSGFMTRNDPPELKKEQLPRHDVIDLLIWAKRMVRDVPEEGPLPKMDSLDWPVSSDYMARVPAEKLGKTEDSLVELGRLDVIPIDEDRDFYERMAELDIPNFTRTQLITVGSLLHEFFKSRRVTVEFPDYYGPMPDDERYVPYDYVFIDSRTGITEVGGLCIGPMSDELVVLCGLNDQNIEGTRAFLEQVGVLEPQGSDVPKVVKPTTFVASPIPDGNLGLKQQRLQTFEKRLGKSSAKLPYHPQLGLLETIFVRDFEDENLTAQYRRLMRLIESRTRGRLQIKIEITQPTEIGKRSDDKQKTADVASLFRAAIASRDDQLLGMAIGSITTEWPKTDEEFRLADTVFRILLSRASTSRFHLWMRWGSLLDLWTKRSTDSVLKLMRSDREIECYGYALAESNLAAEQMAMALVNRGATYERRGEIERSIADFSAVIQMVAAPTNQKAVALINRGVANSRRNEIELELADYSTVIDMLDAPSKQKAMALVNRGDTYRQRGEIVLAIADYTAVMDLPNAPAELVAKALIDRGWARHLTSDFKLAIADAKAAIQLGETSVSVMGNLAVACLADRQTDAATEAYREALSRATGEDLATLSKELDEAVARFGELPGAGEVREMIAARKDELVRVPRGDGTNV